MPAQTAFQRNAFQKNAFQIIEITATNVLELPVNCVLAGDQPYERSGREFEIHPPNVRTKPRMMSVNMDNKGRD